MSKHKCHIMHKCAASHSGDIIIGSVVVAFILKCTIVLPVLHGMCKKGKKKPTWCLSASKCDMMETDREGGRQGLSVFSSL